MFKGRDNSLLTSDVNNDRKFIFLSQENIVDYRPKLTSNNKFSSNTNGSHNNRNELMAPISGKKFPWSKEEVEEKEEPFVYDIVKKQELPVATFVNIADHENYDKFDSRNLITSPDLMIPSDKDEVSFFYKKISRF